MEALYTKYRPKDWDEVLGQESIVKILRQQIETDQIFNCMIFAGISGTGKTTLARIYADKLNKDQGSPIEVDAASNNGVDNVRQITATASERALDCEYKVVIIDEAHMLSNSAWNAFLKCIEEPPKYTIFIFCTTEPNKIPNTIQNRCMRFNFTRVQSYLIEQKLNYICRQETDSESSEVTNYISRICDGEVRKAISYLETCLRYDSNLTLENAIKALGTNPYDDYFYLLNNIIDGNSANILKKIEEMYDNGTNIKKFVGLFTEFCFEVTMYVLCNDIKVTKIPDYLKDKLDQSVRFENNIMYMNYIVDKLLNLKNLIKTDDNEKLTTEITFNQISRFV